MFVRFLCLHNENHHNYLARPRARPRIMTVESLIVLGPVLPDPLIEFLLGGVLRKERTILVSHLADG